MPFQPGFRGKGLAPAFPMVRATANTPAITNTVHALPSGVVAGDLLIILVRFGAVTFTTPTGWTALINAVIPGGSNIRVGALYRVADGSEGSALVITDSGSRVQSSIAYRIDPRQGTPEAATASAASGASIDPPNLAPSWGSDMTLWLAVGWTAIFNAVSSTPTNYGNAIQQGFRSSERALQAASENPGAYTSTSATFGWLAATIAVRGNLA